MRVIRKYPNRRLYDTETGRFINLGQLREMVEQGVALEVRDKATGDDITRALMLQIIVDAEDQGRPILSQTLLQNLICFRGHALQDYMTTYLEESVALFIDQVDDVHTRVGDMIERGPWAALAELGRRNMAWWSPWQDEPRRRPRDEDSD